MNKLLKIFLAIIGAFSVVFDIATPILISMLVINSKYFTPIIYNFLGLTFNLTLLFILCGLIATFYRGIKQLFNVD